MRKGEKLSGDVGVGVAHMEGTGCHNKELEGEDNSIGVKEVSGEKSGPSATGEGVEVGEGNS